MCFFKQTTAYEWRISDWSSDVCSSDLLYRLGDGVGDVVQLQVQEDRQVQLGHFPHPGAAIGGEELQPQLDPAHMVANGGGHRLRMVKINGVERDIDGAGHDVS